MLDKSRVELHLLSIGFHPEEVSAYVEKLQKWVTNSGIEWTVDRLKAVKTSMLLSLTSQSKGYNPPIMWSVRRNRSGQRICKDALVHKVLTLPNTQSNLRIKEAFCRTYTVLRLSSASMKQEKKMMSAIEGPYTGTVDLSRESPVLRDLSRVRPANSNTIARCEAAASNCTRLPDFLGSSKRSPTVRWERRFGSRKLHGPFFKTSSRNDVSVGMWRELCMHDQTSHDIWRSHIHDVSHSVGYMETLPLSYEGEKDRLPAGNVTILQDCGAKARWIANPFLTYQAFGEPLKVKLQEYTLLHYPEVFVHDQDQARAMVVSWLMEGNVVWSYDCTSFTDRFPVAYQRHVLENLRTLGIASQFDIDSFDLIIEKDWMYRNKKLHWTVGQPLGYGPSFALATLTHAVLLDRLTTKVGADPLSFMVVGDDVVIKDKRLAEAYYTEMTNLGVEINLSKSLVSDRYGEFLGKLICTWGVNPAIKVKRLLSDSQFHKAFSFYGLEALKHLPPELVGKCSGLFLPSDLGGDDLRPNGIKYTDWLAITRQDDFARVRRQKVLDAFYGENTVDGEAKASMVKLRSEYFKANSPMPLGLADWAQLTGRRVKTLNRWTGFPDNPRASLERAESSVLRTGWSNTFVHLQDTAHSLNQQCDVSSAIILEMRFGYSINPSEKPYTANHIRKTYERKADSSEERSELHEHGRRPLNSFRSIARWFDQKRGVEESSSQRVKTFAKTFYSFQRNQDGNL